MISLRTLTNRPSKIFVTLLALGALAGTAQQARAAAKIWNNQGTDFNGAGNWTPSVPGAGDVASFTSSEQVSPNLSISDSIAGLLFAGVTSSGYDLTNSNSAVLTLTGYNQSGSGGETSNSSAAAIRSEIESGTNTIDAPLIIAPFSGATSSFYQVGGGTLIVNGAISSAAGVDLSLKGGGTIQLNGANSFATGSIDTPSETVVVGNDSALGSGTFTVNSNAATLQAGGGARTMSNAIVDGGNTTVSGSNAFTFNGSFTSSGSNTRTLTVSNTGGTTFRGSVFLQEATATGRTFTINGTSAVAMNGVVQDGGTGPATLKYTGSNTLTLNNANTYSGGTQETIAGSTIIANHDGALGTGNISLTAGNVTLIMQNGATNQYTGSNASLSIIAGQIINLNFAGTNVVGSLIIDGTPVGPGVYGANDMNPNGDFLGLGTLTVIPEPSVYMLLGVGLLLCGQRFFRRRRSS